MRLLRGSRPLPPIHVIEPGVQMTMCHGSQGTGGTSGGSGQSIKPLFSKMEVVKLGSIEALGVKHLDPARPAEHFLSR